MTTKSASAETVTDEFRNPAVLHPPHLCPPAPVDGSQAGYWNTLPDLTHTSR